MESTIDKLVDEVKNTYIELGRYSSQAYQYRKHGKNGDAQTCMIKVRYLHRKLANLKNELNNIINGSVIYITYEVSHNGEVKVNNAMLTNMTDTDIEAAINIYCKVNGFKFNKILEINRISTKLG